MPAVAKSLYIVPVIYFHKPVVGQKKATKTRDYMGIFRGQGATEYLVLLAVVLIVALVSVALLGFFPGMANDSKITQSDAYWRGVARPFAIIDFAINATNVTNASNPGGANLVIQNKEASGQYTITNILIGTVNSTGLAPTAFSPGETKNIIIPTGFGPNTVGAVYDYNVTISYNTSSNIPSKQYGTKNLVDKYV